MKNRSLDVKLILSIMLLRFYKVRSKLYLTDNETRYHGREVQRSGISGICR